MTGHEFAFQSPACVSINSCIRVMLVYVLHLYSCFSSFPVELWARVGEFDLLYYLVYSVLYSYTRL